VGALLPPVTDSEIKTKSSVYATQGQMNLASALHCELLFANLQNIQPAEQRNKVICVANAIGNRSQGQLLSVSHFSKAQHVHIYALRSTSRLSLFLCKARCHVV
jgi:hypothetical protein